MFAIVRKSDGLVTSRNLSKIEANRIFRRLNNKKNWKIVREGELNG